jgi:hypothetical protein
LSFLPGKTESKLLTTVPSSKVCLLISLLKIFNKSAYVFLSMLRGEIPPFRVPTGKKIGKIRQFWVGVGERGGTTNL